MVTAGDRDTPRLLTLIGVSIWHSPSDPNETGLATARSRFRAATHAAPASVGGGGGGLVDSRVAQAQSGSNRAIDRRRPQLAPWANTGRFSTVAANPGRAQDPQCRSTP
jgi:hypothetical protein